MIFFYSIQIENINTLTPKNILGFYWEHQVATLQISEWPTPTIAALISNAVGF
jgi:hypothetical protein